MTKKQLLFWALLLQNAVLMAQNFEYKLINLPNNDIVVAPTQKRIYASIPSSVPKYGNSICRINPNFATIESSVWVGSEPSKLAISDDEKFLYIGFEGTHRVKKLNLLTNQIEQEITLLRDTLGEYSGYIAGDIAVMPKHPNTYVVARLSPQYFPNYGGIVMADSTKQRPQIVGGHNESTNLLFSNTDTTVFFGVSNDGVWFKYRIDATGINKTNRINVAAGYGKNLQYSAFDSLFYARDGYRFDVRSGLPVGRQFANASGYSFPDPTNANIYYFTGLNEGMNIKIYNRRTLVPIDQFTLPVGSRYGYTEKAVNWGTSGQMASRNQSSLIIFNPCNSLAPKPTITEGATASLCAGQTMILTASGNAARYYWSTGDSTRTISVGKTGTYSVGVADATGCVNYSDPTTVTSISSPWSPSIYLDNLNEPLCVGATAKLTAYSSSTVNGYEWSNGQIGPAIQVTQSIELTAVAISAMGCRSAPSSPYFVQFSNRPRPAKPIITASDTALCASANGTIQARLSANAGYKDYLWSTTQTTQNIVITAYSTQKYWLKATDAFGCQSPSSDSINIRVKDTPFRPTISQMGNTLSVFNTTGVQWFRNGVLISGATNRIYTATSNGFYSAQITSAEGCVSDMSNWVNISGISAVNQLANGQKMDAFPNPVNDILTIYTEGSQHATITLLDTYGRTIWTLPMPEKQLSLPMSNLAKGVYMLGLKNAEGRLLALRKIVKM